VQGRDSVEVAHPAKRKERGDKEMKIEDMQSIKKIYSSYYEKADFSIPSLEKREFGIGNRKKIDARHLSFPNIGEFRRYLRNNTPLFVSHSTAYYDFPGATPIQKKQRRSADLVFDLDIHAEGKYGDYALLDEVKEDLLRLVEDFILNDFGISREHIAVVFSGNRGYHVHVRDPAFLPLGGDERKELVDYIMGQGLNYLDFFPHTKGKVEKLLGPRPDEGGYRGRFARQAIRLLNESPSRLSRVFAKEEKRDFFISGIKEGNWSRTTLKYDDLVKRLSVIAETLPVRSVNTDAGVTQDLSKLIRVPNSIHGETGLIAKIVDNVDSFNPLDDAVLESKETMKVRFTEDVSELQLMGEARGPFKKDEEKELEQPLAVFYVSKGSAYLA
jgi:DNA primase small subunit